MTYLQDFQAQLSNRNFNKFLQLWEEYCSSDQVDVDEFQQILLAVKNSEYAKSFGKIVETALPLWQCIQNKEDKYTILRLLIDLQTTNTPLMADLTLQALQERYGSDPLFNERLRLIGLRSRDHFQGAISNYDLLFHMQQGHFVYHSGGWGTGEVIEISPLRQQVTVEFEHVSGRKHLTFENAYKALIPLSNTHFLARRFADADQLEKEARENPVAVIKMLLRDLGPKTAGEIKEELCELVIPEKEWTKWWQGARAKLKKDPLVEAPEGLKEPFHLRKAAKSSEEILKKAAHAQSDISTFIQSTYNLLRDMTGNKDQAVRNSLKEQLLQRLSESSITPEQELQLCICLESQFSEEVEGRATQDLIQKLSNVEEAIDAIEIIALKKRALTLVREYRKDWTKIFLSLLLTIKHSSLRDYICKELNQGQNKALLQETLEKLLHHPGTHPDCFLWYFQQLISKDADESLPFSDKEGQCRWFESFLVLLNYLENRPDQRDLTKKLYTLLSGKRYALVRSIMEGASLTFVKEFLLLASKCHTLGDHDMKILRSLAAVVHPSLEKREQSTKDTTKHNVIWTTEEGLLKTQEQVRRIGTVEIVENAREIEAARALGDLRENSEYKFALEKRSRLQNQLKVLSEQLGRARVITKDDIHPNEVDIGSVVEVLDPQGKKVIYTILGPWDANPDKNILSFQSQFAQSMLGCKKGDTFQFRHQTLKITGVKSYLDK